MSYREKAELEFKALGWVDENGKFKDDWQELVCYQVLELMDLFSSHGHSGSTAPYAIDLFSKLAKFQPLGPLTGEDWEWEQRDQMIGYRNKRLTRVFKDSIDGRAYDSQGKVFWEWNERPLDEDEEGYPGISRYKAYYICRDSRVYIDFPYTPVQEYIERPSNCE